MKTIIEPFKIKTTEPIKLNSKEERISALEKANLNVFYLAAEDCCIDLLTDSGTGAMSTKQWAAMMLGDESYAGSSSWYNFESTVRSITGMKHIIPTHQGRAAEFILASVLVKSGHFIPSNSHFDTTRANLAYAGGNPVDLLCKEGEDTEFEAPFKGNMDLDRLEQYIRKNGREKIPFCMLTITNNSGGGQPVSMNNVRSVKNILKKHDIPLVIDACRYAENSFFIHDREDGYKDKSLLEIAQEIFSYADAVTMSCKKDGLSNIGGFLACHNDEWAEQFKTLLILKEGFPTYGGLAGRDLEAIAIGLMEALEYDYQIYRNTTIKYMSNKLINIGVPIVRPAGGHAVFLDAKKSVPHIPPLQFPGIAIVNAIYIEGGIRAGELGSVMFATKDEKGNEVPSPLELVRLAFPRRVYTQSHFDYVIEVIKHVWKERDKLPGHCITYQPKFLRHFTCHFERIKTRT